ncbi:MAG: AAA family ATPase [Planctomycetota bacterium]
MPEQDNKTYEHYRDIELPEVKDSVYECNPDGGIGPLSIVNLFIGANHSGKSRMLRMLASEGNLECKLQIPEFENKILMAEQFLTKLSSLFDVVIWTELAHGVKKKLIELQELKNKYCLKSGEYKVSYYEQVSGIIDDLRKILEQKHQKLTPNGERDIQSRIKSFVANTSNFEWPTDLKFTRRIYIPILRGLRKLSNAGDVYHDRTVKDYSVNAQIYTGQEMYQDLKKKLLGKPEGRRAVRKFEQYFSERFFDNKDVTLIPVEVDPVHATNVYETNIEVKIGGADQYPIHHHGDGMQSLLICLFPVFMAPKDDCYLFFIEEPDICMHPSLQRAFIEALMTGDHRRHQYFITTHSNHLIDLTLDYSDISVFHFRKTDKQQTKFMIRASRAGNHDILHDIGAHPSSVFLANSTIFVEGKTDRLYLRAFMRKYCKDLKKLNEVQYEKLSSYREDCHYTFVEYQGSNLVHWTFDPTNSDLEKIKTNFLCASAIVVADGDIANKGTRQIDYKNELGDKFHILDVKEIENLLPEEAVRAVVKEELDGVDITTIRYNKYYDVKLRRGKKLVGLGAYLDKTLKVIQFAGESGTIKQKSEFCEKVIEFMDTNENWTLPPHAKELVKKIYDHIESQNT